MTGKDLVHLALQSLAGLAVLVWFGVAGLVVWKMFRGK